MTEADNFDMFSTDSTQTFDQDGDGYGDNESGNNADDSLKMKTNGKIRQRGTNNADTFFQPTQTKI